MPRRSRSLIVIFRVVWWQTLYRPGYLQERFAPRFSVGAGPFFQQFVQSQIHLSQLVSAQLRQLSNDLLCVHSGLLLNWLHVAARVLSIN